MRSNPRCIWCCELTQNIWARTNANKWDKINLETNCEFDSIACLLFVRVFTHFGKWHQYTLWNHFLLSRITLFQTFKVNKNSLVYFKYCINNSFSLTMGCNALSRRHLSHDEAPRQINRQKSVKRVSERQIFFITELLKLKHSLPPL